MDKAMKLVFLSLVFPCWVGAYVFFSLPASSFAGQETHFFDMGEFLKRVEKEFERINSIKLYFYQSIHRKGQAQSVEGQGIAWFMRPDKMRWEYESPEKEVIVVDGENVFIWEPEANQVMVYKKDRFVPGNLGDIFFPRLTGLERDFCMELKEDSNGSIVIECRPRHELGNVKTIEVEFSKKTYMYSKIRFQDSLGTQTEIRFDAIDINPHLAKGLFEFQIPKGARVYYQE